MFDRLESSLGPAAMLPLGLYFDDRLADADSMIARLGRFAQAADAGSANSFTAEQFYSVGRLANEHDRRDAFGAAALQLFNSPIYGAFDSDLQQAIAFSALKPAVDSGDSALTATILTEVRNPSVYSALLSQRDYEAAWPLIEQRAGDHFATITQDYREWTAARFENFATDRDRFSQAAHALYFDGRFDEAAALARSWRERQGALENIKEGDAWAFNIEAYSLDAMGRLAEADAVFDQLAALSPESRPWLVNFVINRASRLVGQKRFEEGLAAARVARPITEMQGSTYAKMLVAHDHACALYALGQRSEAEAELAFIRENSTAAISVAAETLMCVDRRDEALALLLAGIEKSETRGSVIDGLVPESYDLFYTASALPDTSEFLASSAELRAAFAKWARDIPERFVPAASLKRSPLAVSAQAITP